MGREYAVGLVGFRFRPVIEQEGELVRTRRGGFVAVAIGALAALGLVACGGGEGASDGGNAAPPQGSGAEAPRSLASPSQGAEPGSAIPAVNVREIPLGSEFALGSLVPSDRPVLVWFWAPH